MVLLVIYILAPNQNGGGGGVLHINLGMQNQNKLTIDCTVTSHKASSGNTSFV